MDDREIYTDVLNLLGGFCWMAIEGIYPIGILITFFSLWYWYLLWKELREVPQHTKISSMGTFNKAKLGTLLGSSLILISVILEKTGITVWLRSIYYHKTF